MKIILSGYNSDVTIKGSPATPETISAAYARISRSQKSVDKLRKDAAEDVGKARDSNSRIIFEFGHSSVAEHAVFNFDIIDVSRYAAEFIQHHRLASFTEKSQRYVKFGNAFIIPEELKKEPALMKKYIKFCENCFKLYEEMSVSMEKLGFESGSVKEDARYALPLSTKTQMGMTVNARTLEYMISFLNSQGIAELSETAGLLASAVGPVAPSLVKYTEGRSFFRKNSTTPEKRSKSKRVNLIYFPSESSDYLKASILFEERGLSWKESVKAARSASSAKMLKEMLSLMNPWDKPPRSFEMLDLLFEVRMSASAYAQFKRHRMATIIEQGYDYASAPMIPETVKKAGFADALKSLAEESASVSLKLHSLNPLLQPYSAINGTMRNVLVKMNARELYHFVRLRSDSHAQWEIRELSDLIAAEARNADPIIFSMLQGRDRIIPNK